MARHRWRSELGRQTVQRIVVKLIPAWPNGLYDWQLDLVAPVLDGVDIFGVTATGDGKTVVFGIPILVLLEMNRNSNEYPDLPYRLKPIGIVVTPTKGLSGNIVSSCALLLSLHISIGKLGL